MVPLMVPRLLAPSQAMKSRTCADVFQPCRSGKVRFRACVLAARPDIRALLLLRMSE